jgi:hypothetical protein
MRLAAAGAVFALACLATAAASDDSLAGPATLAPDSGRIASVRMFQDEQFTAKGETPATIGAALAELRPTYVSALLRYGANEKVRPRQIAAWNTVVAAVRAVSPNTMFSVELNAMQYPKVKKLNSMMARVRNAIGPDVWLFDFYTPAAKRYPKVVAAAVANAHANGELIGGNAFGIANDPPIPEGTDYIAVQDFNFKINLKAVRELATRAPVFFHLGNSPNLPDSDGCEFIEDYSTKKRTRYIRKRARQQAVNSFRFAYPVFFPECERNRGGRNATVFTYNAPKDGPMMNTIAGLMDTYD